MFLSDFNPEYQHQKLESKIIASLDRIAHAFRVLLWQESKKYELSPIQIQILIFLKYHAPNQCTVSYLANEFVLTKATISDCIKILEQKELITKAYQTSDRRSYTIHLTEKGKKITSCISQYSKKLHSIVKSMSKEEKENVVSSLLFIIYQLYKNKIITIQRMCFTCRHYKLVKGNHYCCLLEKELENSELRLDCPEHMEKS